MNTLILTLLTGWQSVGWPDAGKAVQPQTRPAAAEAMRKAGESQSLVAPAPGLAAQGRVQAGADPMPLTGLAASHRVKNLCLYTYPVSTRVPECQLHIDQGLGFFYSYVWMEAARSFETATRLDPDCAMAWWCLGRACEKWGPASKHTAKVYKTAGSLRAKADSRERLIIRAALLAQGLEPGAGDGEARKRAAIQQVDELLAQYPDDQEGWYFRAQLAAGGMFGGSVAGVPFYHSLLQVNPLHPGANHELVHFYEGFQRPSLGWKFAGKYIESSPGIPHPHHMQAHLATRLGRWGRTGELSTRAIELEQAYHRDFGVLPKDDHQYAHHLEILLISLIHDGRFSQAQALVQQIREAKVTLPNPWFRLAMATQDGTLATEVIDGQRQREKQQAAHMAALWAWRAGDTGRLSAEVDVLRLLRSQKRDDRRLDLLLWEAQGLLACEQGDRVGGMKLLKRCVDRTKDDFGHHAWGNGAYHMEQWGLGALQVGDSSQAEEAFLEALAHDPASCRAAIGLRILAEQVGNTARAEQYAALAARCWARADPGSLAVLETWIRSLSGSTKAPSITASVSRK